MKGDYTIIKYPRTQHIEGSRLQAGDEDLSQVPFEEFLGRHIVIEEKIDGANTAVSFDGEGNLLLQSRGHYLTGGYREKHYNLFKQWAGVHKDALFEALSSRYVMYGEWMYAKHSIYYDALPHYFMEFDILDRETDRFLDTASRREITKTLPVCSVPVLGEGVFKKKDDVMKFLGNSRFITENHLENLRSAAEREKLDADKILRETDASMTMEGLYLKIEEEGEVKMRAKFVRASFLQTVEQSGSHWLERPIVPNGIKGTIDELFMPKL